MLAFANAMSHVQALGPLIRKNFHYGIDLRKNVGSKPPFQAFSKVYDTFTFTIEVSGAIFPFLKYALNASECQREHRHDFTQLQRHRARSSITRRGVATSRQTERVHDRSFPLEPPTR